MIDAFKFAHLTNLYTGVEITKTFKLLLYNLDLRNSIDELKKIFEKESLLKLLFQYYDKNIINEYTKQFFFQLKDLSFIPEEYITNFFSTAIKISQFEDSYKNFTDKYSNELLKLYPGIESLLSILFQLQNHNNKPIAIPKKLIKDVLDRKYKEKELLHLKNINNKNDNIIKRIENMETYLLEDKKYPGTKLEQRLNHYINQEKLYYINTLINQYFSKKFNNIFGFTPQPKLCDDYKNVLLMYHGTKYNRKLLKNLVEGSRENLYTWKASHPKNIEYIEKMRSHKINIDNWVKGYRKIFNNVTARLPKIILYTEKNPLKVLNMGNYFSTCLSAGGIFSYSAIANAAEINKHVIFAEDQNGVIMARQLIVLTNKGEIVTYEIYNRSDIGIEPLFITFIKEFALYCNTELTGYDKIDSIITPNWYDDGSIWLGDLLGIIDLDKQKKL